MPPAQTTTAPHTAVLIGRFQPLHRGHLALVQQALALAEQVVVVIGSAWQARNPKNPFTWQERAALLRESLPAADQARLRLVPLRDFYDEPRWVAAVQQAVQAQVPAGARVALVGHFKDVSSAYLARFPGWELHSLERQGDFDATPLRDAYLGTPAEQLSALWPALDTQVPPPVLRFLQEWARTPEYAEMQQEWQMIRSYQAAWSHAPYPPVFVTVDGFVRCAGHLLLVQRGHRPGKGLWALPGGFVEPRDTLWQSCLRELQEETQFPLSEAQLRERLQGVEVFDHPDRSLRGRTITHVHALDLGADLPLPAVVGGDDAARAEWVPESALAGMEGQFFEDHFHIVRRCMARFAGWELPLSAE
ncbi:MAG: bifunctional nicotinamide-nucleotide adenylyltransferase/Nudix hydroxylase [Acidovorax sp.]|jgi:bifunctional NMN adenylyltransferase/nudix hydrolase|nr:bifunctional nicotinamide-nucleotide adenylyltransferase/Nudix hydroxylase [Acidovorax sp.]